jgi:hybrid cluster-associated redox disulfide protein
MKEKKLITKYMTMGEVVSKYPQTIPVFFSYGLPCVGCHVAQWESIEEGALAHRIKDIDSLVKDLNKVARKSKIK